MINVGILGAGYIGAVHLDQLSRLGSVRVKYVVDVNLDLAEKAAERYAVENYSDDYDYRKVIIDPEIDIIHNCMPNKYHFSINKEALLAGKQVLSEKPLAMTLEEAEELCIIAAKKKAVTGVYFCYRYYPVLKAGVPMAEAFRPPVGGALFNKALPSGLLIS